MKAKVNILAKPHPYIFFTLSVHVTSVLFLVRFHPDYGLLLELHEEAVFACV